MAAVDEPGFRHERLALSRRSLALPLMLFAAVLAAYAATTLAILASEGWPLVALVPLSGVFVVMLFVIGHDACHQSYTSSRRLNGLIGRIAFLPALHAFTLWDVKHNRVHHRFNNVRGLDYAWVPWSPREFASAPFFSRWKYRFYRDPGGVFFYYLFEIWLPLKIVPRASKYGKLTGAHVLDAALVWVFAAAYAVALAAVGRHFGHPATQSILYAAVLPFLIFSAAISLAIFLHHTHPDVPWYRDVEQWQRENGALFGTVHAEFPWIVRAVFLHIMEHNAHHVAPGVPLYRLQDMQDTVGRAGVTAWKFTVPGYFRLCASCKLFDYDNGVWTDYRGAPTSEPLFGRHAAA